MLTCNFQYSSSFSFYKKQFLYFLFIQMTSRSNFKISILPCKNIYSIKRNGKSIFKSFLSNHIFVFLISLFYILNMHSSIVKIRNHCIFTDTFARTKSTVSLGHSTYFNASSSKKIVKIFTPCSNITNRLSLFCKFCSINKPKLHHPTSSLNCLTSNSLSNTSKLRKRRRRHHSKTH